MLCFAAVAGGIYSGSFFFYIVFHALVHKTKSVKYISINEMVVGITGFIAPVAAGFLSGISKSYVYPYLVGAILLAAMVAFQMVVHKRHPLPDLNKINSLGM